MALVLLSLIVWFLTRRDAFVQIAVALHVVNMTAPQVFRPAAVVWFGLSHVLGLVVSKVILAVVFFVVVTPIGLLRRMLGADAMQLKAFKAGHDSVMHQRNHTFTGKDIEAPY
jgi:multisubunit Na+/H+ antiporter MnhG subunit